MKNSYKEFCTGCGLCHDQLGVKFRLNESGCIYPESLTKEQIAFCDGVCPMGKNGIGHETTVDGLWGSYKSVYKGFASDEKVRFSASSGGVTTALAIYLLRKKQVDGVIQVCADARVPYRTQVVCSRTPEDVIKCCGSRYSQSAPLYEISKLIQRNEKYVFIGKPCDVRAMRNLMETTNAFSENIAYMFSFFCAGTPTEKANQKLLHELNCLEDNCMGLNYRGNGWPGYTTAIDKSGKQHQMEYEKSWMTILGRDIRKCCKFCFDGIGEAADISCGDYWNLGVDNKPDFKESAGQNIVFARTQKGNDLLKIAAKDDFIRLTQEDNVEQKLEYCQPNHKNKRSTAYAKILALKCLIRRRPAYDQKVLKKYAGYANYTLLFNVFKGTVKRIIQKKL